jgi:S-adenosylmethionine:diacylglycerol 3-amino-3-carboxypropyl transferase
MLFYTHVNEDNAVERLAMADMQAGELFVIAGSGERVLALLDHPGISTVYVVDNNREALYLCALKIAALKALDVQTYLRFVGLLVASAEERLQCFAQLSPELAEACREFWSTKQAEIAAGICTVGHFEQFLAKARPWLRFFLGKGFYQCLEKPRAEWRRFPHLRWAMVRWLFARRFTYRLFGLRDQAFISAGAELSAIPAAMQQSLLEGRVQESCLFHLVMNGHLRAMPPEYQPPSFQPEVLKRIKLALYERRLQIHYVLSDVSEALRTLPFQQGVNRFFSLSDLLSFMDWADMEKLIGQIASLPQGQNRAVFRAFVRNRPSDAELGELGRVEDLSTAERTHFYQVFQIDLPHAKP